jgi:hypothetical protein
MSASLDNLLVKDATIFLPSSALKKSRPHFINKRFPLLYFQELERLKKGIKRRDRTKRRAVTMEASEEEY